MIGWGTENKNLLLPLGWKAGNSPFTDAIIKNKKDQMSFDPFMVCLSIHSTVSGLRSDWVSKKISLASCFLLISTPNSHTLHRSSLLRQCWLSVLMSDLDGFLQHSLRFLTRLLTLSSLLLCLIQVNKTIKGRGRKRINLRFQMPLAMAETQMANQAPS